MEPAVKENGLKEKVLMKDKWIRAVFIVFFIIIFELVKIIGFTVAVVQFVFVLITDSANQRLLQFSQKLGLYAAQIIHYISYNTEEKPFPFNDWPK
jgi:hypothetical protein